MNEQDTLVNHNFYGRSNPSLFAGGRGCLFLLLQQQCSSVRGKRLFIDEEKFAFFWFLRLVE